MLVPHSCCLTTNRGPFLYIILLFCLANLQMIILSGQKDRFFTCFVRNHGHVSNFGTEYLLPSGWRVGWLASWIAWGCLEALSLVVGTYLHMYAGGSLRAPDSISAIGRNSDSFVFFHLWLKIVQVDGKPNARDKGLIIHRKCLVYRCTIS